MPNDKISTSSRPSFISAVLRSHRVRGLVFLLLSLAGLYYFFLNTTLQLSPSQESYVEDDLPGFKVDLLEQKIQSLIDNNRIMVFSKSYCPYSEAAKKLLRSYTNDVHVLEVDLEEGSSEIKHILTKLANGHSTFPSIFLDKISIGGSDNLRALADSGDLLSRLQRLGVQLKQDHP